MFCGRSHQPGLSSAASLCVLGSMMSWDKLAVGKRVKGSCPLRGDHTLGMWRFLTPQVFIHPLRVCVLQKGSGVSCGWLFPPLLFLPAPISRSCSQPDQPGYHLWARPGPILLVTTAEVGTGLWTPGRLAE